MNTSDEPAGRSTEGTNPDAGDRKAEHLQLALDRTMQQDRNPFDAYVFEHQALPELDLAQVETHTRFLGRELAAPLLISCMTGGTEEAARINRNLAEAAEETGIAVGVGSQRKAIEDPSTVDSYLIRDFARSVPILANLGAVQLNYGFGLAECRKAVEMIDADALVLHLNPLQEAIQPEGQPDFSGLLDKIGTIVAGLDTPVIVKEVGCGISGKTARALRGEGVEILDVAGQGGTSWARIEASRAGESALGDRFGAWGIPTPIAIARLRRIEGVTLIGSGGLRHGVDLAKAIALGANLGGMAHSFLQAAHDSKNAVVEMIHRTIYELRICMFCTGARTVRDLGRVELHRYGTR